jgi:hypothetical protein
MTATTTHRSVDPGQVVRSFARPGWGLVCDLHRVLLQARWLAWWAGERVSVVHSSIALGGVTLTPCSVRAPDTPIADKPTVHAAVRKDGCTA